MEGEGGRTQQLLVAMPLVVKPEVIKSPVCYIAPLRNMGLIVDAGSTFAFPKGKGRRECGILGYEEKEVIQSF